jgi:hypothetical protein
LTERLVTWVARDLEAHLEELATAARAWREGRVVERPIVTIHLTSGQHHVGHVLELVRSTLALQSIPRRGSGELDVTVIPTSRIEAVTFHAVQTQSSPAETTATSMLDLKRRAKALGELLTTRLGRAVTVDVGAGELAVLAPLFESLRGVLDGVCADELGRTSLAQRVERIRVTTDAATEVSIANATLVVSTTTRLAAERLRRELDALL